MLCNLLQVVMLMIHVYTYFLSMLSYEIYSKTDVPTKLELILAVA